MIPQELKQIAQRIKEQGGKAFLVGGFVRDFVLGIKNADFDCEVFGLDKETVGEILQPFGKVSVAGVSFGIIILTLPDGTKVDFALPRRESKIGRGHTKFKIEIDRTITQKEAASRRDFTFNAMSMDIDTGEIIDFFNGQDDLRSGVIKATSPSFVDDPLRVARGVQLSSRLCLSLEDEETIQMCQSVICEFKTIAKERLWMEFEKWASKGVKPSLGIDFLIKTLWIGCFPELLATVSITQDKSWHPELWLMDHQKQAVDLAVEFSNRENLTHDERLVLVFASLCHDFGKVTTTELCDDGHIRSKRHDKEGVEPTRKFLESIDAPIWLVDQVCALVSEHMFNVHCRKPTAKSIRRLARRVKPSNIKMLALLMEIDASARFPKPRCKPVFIDKMLELAEENDCQEDEVKDILMGRHLIQLGFKHGKDIHFGDILNEAKEAQLDGVFSDLDGGIEWLKERVK